MKQPKARFNKRPFWHYALILLVVGFFGTVGYTSIHASFGLEAPEPTENIIVKYRAGADPSELQQHYKKHRAREQAEIKPMRLKVVQVPKKDRDQAITDLAADPTVQYAEPDYTLTNDAIPNDPDYTKQWAWPKIKTDAAWDRTKGAGVVIAVIDSGINLTHPDLANKTVTGYDFFSNDNDPMDEYKHGTWVSGTIAAATNNGIGVAGGCWDCKIMPIKVQGNTDSSSSSNIIKGIQYAIDHNADIINISSGGSSFSQSFQDAITNATSRGLLVVTSAGNDGTSTVQYPAGYPDSLSIAATEQDDSLATWSNSASQTDLAAPGYIRVPNFPGTGYTDVAGTSFSAPIVSSAAALLLSAYPQATVAQLKSALLTTADPCCGGKIANGRVNTQKALDYLAAQFPGSDTTKPTISITAPAAASVSGSVSVTASASDNVGVSRVEMKVDNGAATSRTASPYTFTWNTTQVADGTHTITMTAYDAAGNSASATKTVTVSNTSKQGDLNGDSKVNITDLSVLLSAWNTANATADINKSGKVDITDLSILLSSWTG